MMTLGDIARGLDDCFRLLTDGDRTRMSRHQTLQASMDWSHGLLSDGEQALLRRLSVFAGGWTLDAAEQVCPGEGIDRDDVLRLVTGLIDNSLVDTDKQGSSTRYRLLEIVRQYAAARLADAGEVDGVRALDAAGEEPTPLRGRVLAGRGNLAVHGGAYEAADRWAQAALAVGHACGDSWALDDPVDQSSGLTRHATVESDRLAS